MRHGNAAKHNLLFTQPVFISINLLSPLRCGCVFCNIKTLQFPRERMKVEVGGLVTKLSLSDFDNKIAIPLSSSLPKKEKRSLHIISYLIQF